MVRIKVEAPVDVKEPKDGTPPPVSFPTHSIIPPPFPGSLQWPNLIWLLSYFLTAIFNA